MDGSINIYGNHRTYYNKCKYWAVSPKNRNNNNIVYEDEPSGTFMAKEKTAKFTKKDMIDENFMFDSSIITLETEDDIHLIKSGYLVMYEGTIWRIINVQKKKKNRRGQFISSRAYRYTINLKEQL